MRMPAFALVRPRAVEGALEHLARHGAEAMLVAGGTDVVPNLRAGLFSPRVVVDIKGLGDLSGCQGIGEFVTGRNSRGTYPAGFGPRCCKVEPFVRLNVVLKRT